MKEPIRFSCRNRPDITDWANVPEGDEPINVLEDEAPKKSWKKKLRDFLFGEPVIK